jgi:hypothetical protein
MKRELRSSGSLRTEQWRVVTDVFGQSIGLIFRGQEYKNITTGCVTTQKSAVLSYVAAEAVSHATGCVCISGGVRSSFPRDTDPESCMVQGRL